MELVVKVAIEVLHPMLMPQPRCVFTHYEECLRQQVPLSRANSIESSKMALLVVVVAVVIGVVAYETNNEMILILPDTSSKTIGCPSFYSAQLNYF